MGIEKPKPYTRQITIDGVQYTAQFSGINLATRGLDECNLPGTNIPSMQKLTDFVLQHVIVDPPGLTADDFEDIDTLGEVVNFAAEVMNGRFRKRENTRGAKKTS